MNFILHTCNKLTAKRQRSPGFTGWFYYQMQGDATATLQADMAQTAIASSLSDKKY